MKAIRLRFSPKICEQQVAPFDHKPLHASSFIDFLWILRKTTRILSIATRWRKNSMVGATACTSSRAWAWVVFLQLLRVKRFHVDNAWLKSERFLNGSVVFPDLLRERSTNFVCSEDILILTSGNVNFFCKNVPITTNIFISIVFEHPFTESMISQETIMDPRAFSFDASPFQIMGQMIFFAFWSFPRSVAMRSSLLDYVFWNWEKVQCIYNETSIGHSFFQEMTACAIDDAFTPVW